MTISPVLSIATEAKTYVLETISPVLSIADAPPREVSAMAKKQPQKQKEKKTRAKYGFIRAVGTEGEPGYIAYWGKKYTHATFLLLTSTCVSNPRREIRRIGNGRRL